MTLTEEVVQKISNAPMNSVYGLHGETVVYYRLDKRVCLKLFFVVVVVLGILFVQRVTLRSVSTAMK